MSRYDIVIAGGGLAGLECAAILAKEGMNVCVLEQNHLIGGCFQSFTRFGRLLDTGIHYVGSMDEGQLLHTIFKYMGITDKLRLQRLDEEGFDRIYLAGREYRYAMGYDRFVETLAQDFPHERAALRRYVTQLQEIGNTSSVELLRRGIFSDGGYKYFSHSASAFIEECIQDTTLRRVLTGTVQLYGGVYDRSPLYCHGMINNSYISGAYRFVGGSAQVPDALADVVRTYGGEVRNNSRITRFVVDGARVKAVYVNDEEYIEADRFISTIHPQATLALLDDTPTIKKAYKRRIAAMPNTYGIFTVYLLTKPGTVPYDNFNRFLHTRNDMWFDEHNDMQSCLVSQQAVSPHNDYADVVTLLTPTSYDEVSRWENTRVEHRGDDYRAYKEQKTRSILDYVRRHGLDYEGCIDHIITSSPLTYRDYTATTQGAAYGFEKNYKCPHLCVLSSRTHLPNFYFSGQNLNVHGALGVSLTSLLTCAEFLGQDYLAKKVGYA